MDDSQRSTGPHFTTTASSLASEARSRARNLRRGGMISADADGFDAMADELERLQGLVEAQRAFTHCQCCGQLKGNCMCWGGNFGNIGAACSPKDHGRAGYGV